MGEVVRDGLGGSVRTNGSHYGDGDIGKECFAEYSCAETVGVDAAASSRHDVVRERRPASVEFRKVGGREEHIWTQPHCMRMTGRLM